MHCPSCQSNNRQGVKFCEECGAKMEMACPVCNAKIPLGKKFCGECGSKTSHANEMPPRELSYDEKLAKIKKYLPNGLIDKILSEKKNIEGERKQVSVVFCNMEGFTQLVEKYRAKIYDQSFEIKFETQFARLILFSRPTAYRIRDGSRYRDRSVRKSE
jgi:hypothetical protein